MSEGKIRSCRQSFTSNPCGKRCRSTADMRMSLRLPCPSAWKTPPSRSSTVPQPPTSPVRLPKQETIPAWGQTARLVKEHGRAEGVDGDALLPASTQLAPMLEWSHTGVVATLFSPQTARMIPCDRQSPGHLPPNVEPSPWPALLYGQLVHLVH